MTRIFWILYVVVFWGFAHLALQRKNFHYFFGTEFLVLKQDGIFLKKEWVIPYDTIKNLFVGAGPIERHIGLAFLDFESTSTQKKQKLFNTEIYFSLPTGSVLWIGFAGESVVIPGLSKESAFLLKKYILERAVAHGVVSNIEKTFAFKMFLLKQPSEQKKTPPTKELNG